jgi:hypothetical protein
VKTGANSVGEFKLDLMLPRQIRNRHLRSSISGGQAGKTERSLGLTGTSVICIAGILREALKNTLKNTEQNEHFRQTSSVRAGFFKSFVMFHLSQNQV